MRMSNNKCTGCGRRPRRLPRRTCDLQRQERQKEKFVNKKKKVHFAHVFCAHKQKQMISFPPSLSHYWKIRNDTRPIPPNPHTGSPLSGRRHDDGIREPANQNQGGGPSSFGGRHLKPFLGAQFFFFQAAEKCEMSFCKLH